MRIAFAQISNTLINPDHNTDSVERSYYEALYNKVPGYHKNPDFWEIPLWIAKASYNIPEGELYVIRNVLDAIHDLSFYDTVMLSVLEANKAIVKTIIEALPSNVTIILGGYVDPQYFFCSHLWFYELSAGIKYLGYTYNEGVSYKLFQGMSIIPRLSLSEGCLYRCAFCTITKQIVEHSYEDIIQQVYAINDLTFELVYINDKTFGQAKNHNLLPELYKKLRFYNPYFQGFIVQTTATTFCTLTPEVLACIKYVELGVESYNDEILHKLHKPHTTTWINKACLKALNEGVKVIPNLIVSLPGENETTYSNTINFLKRNAHIISHVNIYSLVVYNDTELSAKLSAKLEDNNENNYSKPWNNALLDAELSAKLSAKLEDNNENNYNKPWGDAQLDKEFYHAVLSYGKRQIERRSV